MPENIITHLPKTLVSAFLSTAERSPDMVAVRTVGETYELTWSQVRSRVENFSAGLQRLGLKKGDLVAIMLQNRPEFLIADLSCLCLGGATFSIYPTLPANQICEIFENSETRFIICERGYLGQVRAACALYTTPTTVILLEGGDEFGTVDWRRVEQEPNRHADPLDFRDSVAALSPDDLAVLIYTSGTTGPAKGVELTHGAIMEIVRIDAQYLELRSGWRFLSWLPTAGMASRTGGYWLATVYGGTVAYCHDHRLVADALPDVMPNVFFAPPRFWEKMRVSIEEEWRDQSGALGAVEKAIEKVCCEQANLPVSEELVRECITADREWFAPMRHKLGFSAHPLQLCCGGAASPRGLLEFFFAIGLPLADVYGQSESCGLGTRSPSGAIRIGTVGKVQPGVEAKLAKDGEFLLRTPAQMRGYRKRPDATAEAIDADGWLHTGDIANIDDDGYVRLIGRKKEMIINAFGKNMSPVNIEAAMTTAGPFISQAVVVGEARPYNVAILTLDGAYIQSWAAAQGIDVRESGKLKQNPRILAEVEAEIQRANSQLARVEQIKRYRIADGEWLPGSPEVTPTMKLRRQAIYSKYANEIEALYAGTNGG
jgi:long-chain acyl-CoA synthetase